MVESVARVWRHWLLGREFVLRTDHGALREILTKKGEDFTLRQLRWFEKLEPFSFTVKHIKGKENVVPDALSRTPKYYAVNALEVGRQPEGDIHVDEIKDAITHDIRIHN